MTYLGFLEYIHSGLGIAFVSGNSNIWHHNCEGALESTSSQNWKQGRARKIFVWEERSRQAKVRMLSSNWVEACLAVRVAAALCPRCLAPLSGLPRPCGWEKGRCSAPAWCPSPRLLPSFTVVQGCTHVWSCDLSGPHGQCKGHLSVSTVSVPSFLCLWGHAHV